MIPAAHPIAPTILVVDDQAEIRRLVALVLEGDGFLVLTARDGVDALRMAREHVHIDLLVTDVVMPGLDGPAAAAQIVAEHPSMPVLFISGGSERFWFAANTTFQFLPKPFAIDALIASVRNLLAKHASLSAA